ncbi:S41 family peptidase [Alteromonas oceanisediminis]|uniref:S41 family peptidase n=1 Tax=Alteromonas oceanisediminis TaxID=2836180 RepID=UPI001BDA77A2|nr:S41 family peptidase [Alteromonas oceanisediminis]MBT0587947.1 hypothetical protein [Alteromonas oceanisediminis]
MWSNLTRLLVVVLTFFMPISVTFASCSELPSAKFPKLPYTDTILPTSATEDLHILETTLRSNHPSLFDYQSKAEFEMLTEELSQNVACAKTSADIFALASQMVASIGDAHTYVINPHELEIQAREPLFPLAIDIVNNQMFIDEKQVEEINDMTVASILKSLQRYLPSDANTTPYKNAFIQQDFATLFFTLLDRSSQFEIRFVDGQRMTLAAELRKTNKKSKEESHPSLKIMGSTATIKIPSWEDSSASSFNTPLAETAQNSFLGEFIFDAMSKVTIKDVNQLVVDMRGNKGGKSGPAALLLSFLISEPFKYYEEITVASDQFPTYEHVANKSLVDFYKSEKAQQLIEERGGQLFFKSELMPKIIPQPNVFVGDIVVMVDKFSLSVSTDVVANLIQHTNATVVGDEIGGSLTHYSAGNYLDLVLPNSKIRVNVPLQRLVY